MSKFIFKLEVNLNTNEREINIRQDGKMFSNMSVDVKDFADFVRQCNEILQRITVKKIT